MRGENAFLKISKCCRLSREIHDNFFDKYYLYIFSIYIITRIKKILLLLKVEAFQSNSSQIVFYGSYKNFVKIIPYQQNDFLLLERHEIAS